MSISPQPLAYDVTDSAFDGPAQHALAYVLHREAGHGGTTCGRCLALARAATSHGIRVAVVERFGGIEFRCATCNGSGYVEVAHASYSDPEAYSTRGECPCCGHSGAVDLAHVLRCQECAGAVGDANLGAALREAL